MTACPRCGLTLAQGALALCPRCLLADDADEPPPVVVGLVLEEEIGRGGMGRVYRARHLRLDRPVAVKFLPPSLASDPAFEARFAREARALGALTHPHIVAVHDFGTTAAGESYLVMELVPGGTLASRLPLPLAEAVRIGSEICEGLAYAHDKGLVHRDIKPENVLFDEHGRAKLADFGLARLADPQGGGVTRPSMVLGTPAYMPPEARAGAPPDARTDVYAVGVLLYQMTTGRLPAGTTTDAPPALVPIVRRAMATDPRERFASAAELRAALAPLLVVPDAPVPSLPPEEESWERAVALALAGATAVALYALLVSFTPRTLDPGDALPFIAFGTERLADGRISTRARFETWPTLAAAGAFAVALAAYGLLRRHWRHAGIETSTPDRPLAATRALFRLALVIDATFVFRLAVENTRARVLGNYTPVIGGVLELLMVYLFWRAGLESLRTGRRLRRERLLWFAVALSLLPPAVSFLRIFSGRGP